MQIVVLDGRSVDQGDLSWDSLREAGTLSIYDRTLPELTQRRLIGADVVLTRSVYIGEEELLRAKNLKLIVNLAGEAGLVEPEAVERRGITLCSAGEDIAEDVAQHVFAMLLEVVNSPAHYDLAVHRGRWTASADFCFVDTRIMALRGMKLGILGCGATGCAVARVAQAFGMEVIGFDITKNDGFCGSFVPLNNLLAESDVLTLHCGVNGETEEFIQEETIARMKPGAILLNTADGRLVREADVCSALENGRLYAFCTDVAAQEPLPKSSPLLEAPNCIITPHIAWASRDTRQEMLEEARRCVDRLLKQ